MITTSANRLLMAALLCASLAPVAHAGDAGVAQTEPGGSAPTQGETSITIAAPDADKNVPDAINQSFSYYTVSGATLRGRSSTTDTNYVGLGCVYVASGTDRILNSDAPIPDGSLIKFLRIYYNDTNAANGVRGFITRYAPGTPQTTDLVSVESPVGFASGYGTALSSEINEVVDGTFHAYTVIGWPDAIGIANQICGLRVAYYGPDFFANGFEN